MPLSFRRSSTTADTAAGARRSATNSNCSTQTSEHWASLSSCFFRSVRITRLEGPKRKASPPGRSTFPTVCDSGRTSGKYWRGGTPRPAVNEKEGG